AGAYAAWRRRSWRAWAWASADGAWSWPWRRQLDRVSSSARPFQQGLERGCHGLALNPEVAVGILDVVPNDAGELRHGGRLQCGQRPDPAPVVAALGRRTSIRMPRRAR